MAVDGVQVRGMGSERAARVNSVDQGPWGWGMNGEGLGRSAQDAGTWSPRKGVACQRGLGEEGWGLGQD